MRRGGVGTRRYPDRVPISGKAAWRGDRNLQRSPNGDVFCDSGVESCWNKNQKSFVREENIPELFPKIGDPTASRAGRHHSRSGKCEGAIGEGTLCGVTSAIIACTS